MAQNEMLGTCLCEQQVKRADRLVQTSIELIVTLKGNLDGTETRLFRHPPTVPCHPRTLKVEDDGAFAGQ